MSLGTFKQLGWSRPQIAEERALIERQLSVLPGGPGASLNFCIQQSLDVSDGGEVSLRRFLYLVKTLSLHAEHGGLTPAQVRKFAELGASILTLAGVKPTVSRVSFLYGELHEALSRAYARDGRTWDSAWEFCQAQLMARRAPSSDRRQHMATLAAFALRLGHSRQCLLLLESAAAIPASRGEEEELFLELCARRHVGEMAEFKAIERVLVAADPGRWSLDAEWQSLWLRLRVDHDPRPILARIRGDRRGELGVRALDGWLLSRAASQKFAQDLCPALETIRKRLGNAGIEQEDPVFWRILQAIDQCHDPERPLEARVGSLTSVVQDSQKVQSIDRQALVLAAVLRWLVQVNQYDLATLVRAEYSSLSLRVTAGESSDALGIVSDLDPKKLIERYARTMPEAGRSTTEFHPLTDLAEIAKTIAQVMKLHLEGSVKRWVSAGSDQEQIKLDSDNEIAKLIARFLSRRKGAMLKMGQICSYMEGPFGTEMAQEFEILQSQVAPIPSDAAASVFKREFGRAPAELFKDWHAEPFAAGSIGQVHEARLDDGRRVAVKIQYPNIRRIIEIDMRRVRLTRAFFAVRLPAVDAKAIVEEARTITLAETDYQQEAANIEEFKRLFAEDKDVYIPGVVGEASSAKVLTVEFVEGMAFADFVATATQAERDHAAKTISRFVWRSNNRFGIFNCDVQPGNYLFQDARVAFVDFGCFKRFPEAVVVGRREMIKAFLRQDLDALAKEFIGLGFIDELKAEEVEQLFQVMSRTFPYLLYDEPFQFTLDVPRAIYRANVHENPLSKKLRIPKDLIFSLRIEFALSAVLARLGANVCWRDVVLQELFQGEPLPRPFAHKSAA